LISPFGAGRLLFVDRAQPKFLQAEWQIQLGSPDLVSSFSIHAQLRNLANDRPLSKREMICELVF
jgi:hypothetical protein